jgi:hypothetical protein
MRMLVAVFLVLVLVAPAGAEIFGDIAGIAAQRAIERLAAKGIVARPADGRFRPADAVTRLETVLFLVRILGVSGQGLKLPAFKDGEQIPESARPAVAAAVTLGTMSAKSVETKKGAITFTLTSDKVAYGPDEEILLTLIVTNTGKQDVQFEYNNSQFHDFIIKAADGAEVARWSLGRAFLPVDKPVPLVAGKSLNFTTRWKQLDQNDRPIGIGRYEIIGVHTTKTNATSLSLFFQKGLVAGYPDNTFRPDQVVTRAELAAWTVRAAGLDTEAFARAKATLPVSDNADVLDWARGSAAVALERKFILPIDGAFRPAQGARRADAAVALDALMTVLKKYDYLKGIFRGVDGRPPVIRIEDDKKAVRTFRMAAAHAVYRNDRSVALGALRPGDTVQVLKESDAGDVVYIEATGP